jgi:hypothetical protein
MTCFDQCCGRKPDCDVVCPGNDAFVVRVREVGGFDLSNIPRTAVRPMANLPLVVPLLYGGNSRTCYQGSVVALPLYRLFHRGDPAPVFEAVEAIAAEFRFTPGAAIVLSGTADDRPLEHWWSRNGSGRRRAARALASLGITAATSPNFSLFTDRPRTDDMYSLKRIALAWQELVDEGLPSALHVNARTDTDWHRWIAFIAARPEVDVIAYEFGTGAGSPDRMGWHVAWLVRVARSVGRPLRLIVRGGLTALPNLNRVFSAVTMIDTSAYIKTMKRQRATLAEDGSLSWQTNMTTQGDHVDSLFGDNVKSIETAATNLLADAAGAKGANFMRYRRSIRKTLDTSASEQDVLQIERGADSQSREHGPLWQNANARGD